MPALQKFSELTGTIEACLPFTPFS
uniref:Transmembrane protein 56 isoform X2 n=1 Tax=Rhizophora mucronata TaxID=61149 RepID=A0A2P2K8U2_RHIMU